MDDNYRSMKVRPMRFFFREVKRYLADPKNSSINQFVRYSFVGVLNTVIGYGAFFIFVNYIQYLIALGCAHIIGVINSYAWNHNWVFNRRLSIVEFIKFNAVYIIAFAANAGALVLCVDFLKIEPRLAQFMLIPLVLVISFTGNKYWSFKANDN
jgi:putative flippase GtrA